MTTINGSSKDNASGGDRSKKKKTMEDYLVRGLEEVEPAYEQFDGKMYAGLVPVTRDDDRKVTGEMMFWMFEPRRQSIGKSMVVWLNGGPGCSSFNCGVMMEHSPVTQPLHEAGYCCLKTTPQLHYNNHTWTRATTMLYVEYPLGTGFSFGSPLPETEKEAAGDLWQFMMNFFDVFEHLREYDFFVFGESYAGMFVPSIAKYFHERNVLAEQARLGNVERGSSPDSRTINLKGAALGNGWMDPKVQGPATIDYSWWHGLIDEPTRDALHAEWGNCLAGKPGSLKPPFHPLNVQDDCGMMWGILQAAGNPNAYDITTWDPNVDQVTFTSEGFYNSPQVKRALHAPLNITWHGCRWGSGRRRLQQQPQPQQQQRRLYMDNDRPWSVVPYLAELLDVGIPVLVYNGDRDMTTNMVGTELLLNRMQWSGADKWLDSPRGIWIVPDTGRHAGWAKECDRGLLTYVVVYNSGHMVPYNRPDAAFDLLTRFLQRQSFVDVESPQIRVKDEGTQDKQELEDKKNADEDAGNGGKQANKEKAITSPESFNEKLEHHGVSNEDATATRASLANGPALSSLFLQSYHHHGTAKHMTAVAMVSMLLGVLVTFLIMRPGGGGTRNRRGHRYEHIPDATE